MPVRITNNSDSSAFCSDIANGLLWAADNGAHVANISYDVNACSSVATAGEYFFKDKGGLTVVAAANAGKDPGYSDSLYMISVSATDSSDNKTSWSNFGHYIDVAAPGASIWTTKMGGGYGTASGTSLSSPITAGVVALMKAANPSLSPATLEQVLESTAKDLGGAGWDTYYGYGRVDAAAAVQSAKLTENIDSQAPSTSITSPSSSSTVAGVASVDVSATDNVGVTRVDLYANSALVASDTTSPFGFSWDTTKHADGSTTLVAYSYDAANNQGLSQGVSVTVKNSTDTEPPKVQITSPGNGVKVTGVNVSIKANASDNVAMAKITATVDGKTLCTSTSTSTSATLNCNWNIKKVAAGAHTISAIAEDAAGNKTTTSISVTK